MLPAAPAAISIDQPQQESDARHEPPPDVHMNGHRHPVRANGASPASQASSACDPDDEGPPTKRARMHSDADQASTHFATPPPASAVASPLPESTAATVFEEPPPPTGSSMLTEASSAMDAMEVMEPTEPTQVAASSPPPTDAMPTDAPPPMPSPPPMAIDAPPPPPSNGPLPIYSGTSSISTAQFRFMQSTIRNLKKTKDASPFLFPVDPIKLNIPHYPTVVKTPMDFSTVDRKLSSSNPNKPDPNPHNPRYFSVDQFVADVRLIFTNCELFNGPEHVVTAMGKRVLESFIKSIKQMPPPAEAKPIVAKKVTPPPPPPPAPVVKKEKPAPRRPSTAAPPVIRRSEPEPAGRPKREIHPPPPKDLPYADLPKKPRKINRGKDDGTADQFRYCARILSDLHRKQHQTIASPFYEPVDWLNLDIPDYPKIIKKPMDLSTMRRKLDAGEYATPQKFYEDFKLMIRNCFTFNPTGTLVNQAGIELQRLFDDKWRNLPSIRTGPSELEESEDDDEDEDRLRTIATLETQMETMKNSLIALKGAKPGKEKKKKEKRDKPPAPSASKAPPKPPKASSKKKSSGKKHVPDDDVLSFDQKKELSESIGKLDGSKLERVINIIHEGVPEIKNSSEEIELEVDLLPPSVLIKLYNFVIKPLRAAPKRNRGKGTGTGTGGLKRKSMDEDVEAEKIRMLEQRMALFDQGASVPSGMDNGPRRGGGGGSDSDSSSGSDSSGSDSE